MRMFMGAAALLVCVWFSGGCATIVNGTSQTVAINTVPAGALLHLDDGTSFTTPASLKLKRNRDYTITFTKDGYHPETRLAGRTASWWLAGNILVGGIIGLAIDVISGGGYRFHDEEVTVNLRPMEVGAVDPDGAREGAGETELARQNE
jgi:hypothetical protein